MITIQGWKTYSFKEIASLSKEKYNPKKETLNLPCIELEHIESETGRLLGHTNSLSQGSIKNRFKPGDVLYGKLRPYLKKYYFPDFEGVCSSEIWVLRNQKGKIRNKYLYYLVQTNRFNKSANISIGTKMPRADWNFVSETIFPIPTLKEQDKIISVLSTWDKAIKLKEKLIEQKKKQKKGLMQKLLTGKMRLPRFKGDWRNVKIGEIIKEINEKSIVNNQFQVLSVTKDGIVAQNEHFKRQVASENNVGYKIVRRNNLVFSAMNLWMGSLDVLTKYDVGIVSPAYKVFEFKNEKMIPSFGKYFMKSEHMIWLYNVNSEQGASIVRRNLDLKGLLNTNVKIPSIEEQREISSVLLCLDNEIDLLIEELKEIKNQKKGLMQLLLTGKVRVKV